VSTIPPRTPRSEPEPLRFAGFEIDPVSVELRRGGSRIELSPQGVRVLAHLLEHRGALVPREELYRLLWPEGEVDMDRGLNTLIRQVRRAIGDSATEPSYIRTYPRRGYRFVAVENAEPCTTAESPAGRSSRRGDRGRWRAVAVLAGVAGAIALVRSVAGAGSDEWAGLPEGAREPMQLASYLLQRPRFSERLRAEQPLLAALAAAPASHDVRAHLAEVRMLQGRLGDAAALVGFEPRDPALTAHEAFIAGHLQLLTGADWSRAEALLARAAAERPQDPRYQTGYAFVLALTGRPAAARERIARAWRGDPIGAAVAADGGLILLYAGDPGGAARVCETALQAEPGFRAGLECAFAAWALRGDDSAAAVHAARIIELTDSIARPPGWDSLPAPARLARFRRWRAARADAAGPQIPDPYAAAVAWVEAGRPEDALRALDTLAARPRSFAGLTIGVDPRFRPLAGRAGYREVLVRLGSP